MGHGDRANGQLESSKFIVNICQNHKKNRSPAKLRRFRCIVKGKCRRVFHDLIFVFSNFRKIPNNSILRTKRTCRTNSHESCLRSEKRRTSISFGFYYDCFRGILFCPRNHIFEFEFLRFSSKQIWDWRKDKIFPSITKKTIIVRLRLRAPIRQHLPTSTFKRILNSKIEFVLAAINE